MLKSYHFKRFVPDHFKRFVPEDMKLDMPPARERERERGRV
jgi:hypothetical protein